MMKRPEFSSVFRRCNRDGAGASRGRNRVLQDHRDRHRPDAAGDRRHVRRPLGRARDRRRRRASARSSRFIPTSITVAPALTMSAPIRCGRPTAATRMSASSVCRSRSCVREWQIVTVALRWRRRCAIGLPTMRERPTTTARAPFDLDLVLVEHPHDPERRARDERRPAEVEPAGVDRVDAVDVLRGVDRLDHAVLVDVVGQRQLDEDAVDVVVGVQLGDAREQLVLRRVGGQPEVARVDAGLRRGLLLQVDVDVRGGVVADEHRGEARRGRARRPFGAPPRAPSRRAPCRR